MANPEYLVSTLEKVKMSLIANATRNAYERASEFAKTGEAKVGTMKSANQGAFYILPARGGNNGRQRIRRNLRQIDDRQSRPGRCDGRVCLEPVTPRDLGRCCAASMARLWKAHGYCLAAEVSPGTVQCLFRRLTPL